MDNPKTLDLSGGWENIVNNVERHNARTQFHKKLHKRKLMKKIGTIAELVIVAALAITLDLCGLLAPWVAVAIAASTICVACFLGGRIFEGTTKCE